MWKDNPSTFVKRFHAALGLWNGTTGRNTNMRREPVLEGQSLNPSSASFKALYEALVPDDPDGRKLLTPSHQMPGINNWLDPRSNVQVNTMEDGGVEIGPSQFANVSAYNAAALGLLEAKFLEAYRRPEFIAEQLAETIATDKIQEKFIGISMVGDVAEERRPGDRHARFNLSERYVTTPINVNRAVAVDVTREAVMFDRTRELLKQAESGAETLALRREYITLDVFLGNVNSYNYNGTSYNTYATSGNWINKIGSATNSPLVDWTNFNAALELFAGMTDQETGQPISVWPKDVLTMPTRWATARTILHATGIERRSPQPSASPSLYATDVSTGENPMNWSEFNFNLLGSPTYPYAKARLISTDATGGGISAANADKRWYIGDFKKAFVYTQNIPLTTVRASATEYEMADRGLVFSLFADEMGMAGVRDPRYAVECTE
jgi:hypothetical protein